MFKILILCIWTSIFVLLLTPQIVNANGQLESFTTVSQINPESTNLPIDSSWYVIDEQNSGTDIGATINTLINGGNYKIYLKNGTYYSNSTVNINHSNITITGESKENTVWVQTNTSTSFNISADASIFSFFSIKNEYEIAFFERNSNFTTISDTIIYSGPNNSAIYFSGTTYPNGTDLVSMVNSSPLDSNNSILNNTIYSDFSGDGIYITNQDTCFFQGNTISGSRLAFYLNRNSDVSNNSFTNSQNNGIRACIPAINNNISFNTISNTLASGIVVTRFSDDIANTFRGSNFTIGNNTISNTNYFGIELTRLDNSIIQNNTITNVDLSGIYLLYDNNLTLLGNNILNSNRSTINTPLYTWNNSLNAGIFADYAVQNCTFDSNTETNLDNNCPYGIRIQSGNLNTGNSIVNNNINGLFTNDFYYAPGSVLENGNTKALSPVLIPTPSAITTSTSSSIEVVWDTLEGYSNYDIEVNGLIIHCGNVNTYVSANLPVSTTYQYRLRISGGYWSDYIIASTYVGDIIVNPSTSGNTYYSEWTDQKVSIQLSGIPSYDKFQYTLTPSNSSSWIDISGDTLILSNDQNHCVYYFRAIDSSQNVLSQTSGTEINIDKTTPSLLITGNPTQYIDTQISLNIIPTVGNSGIKKITLSKNGGEQQDITNQSHYTINENGEYLFTLINGVGTNVTYPVSISKIDNITPDINISGNPDTWTSKDVTLNFTKNIGCSGLQSLTISNDLGTLDNITNLSSYTVSENGVYTFTLTNGLEHQITKSVHISKIDKIMPTITLQVLPFKLPMSIIKVAITTTSGISGIDNVTVQKDGGEESSILDQNTCELTEPGTYVFTVTNGAGEKSSTKLKVNPNNYILPENAETVFSYLTNSKNDRFDSLEKDLENSNELSPFFIVDDVKNEVTSSPFKNELATNPFNNENEKINTPTLDSPILKESAANNTLEYTNSFDKKPKSFKATWIVKTIFAIFCFLSVAILVKKKYL